MLGKVTLVNNALLVTPDFVSAVQRLNSINDLRKLDLSQPGSKHILVLLHWFANVVDIDNKGNIWLTFDPDNNDYGSHHYGNYEGLLDLPYGYKYYTVGNLNPEIGSSRLPGHVVNPPMYAGRNNDRIIFGVSQNGELDTRRSVDLVYITQHFGIAGDTTYDPERTYEITTNLLRQIREFSVGTNAKSFNKLRTRYGSSVSETQFPQMKTLWGDLACLGLFLFIVIQQDGYNLTNQSSKPQRETSSKFRQPSPSTEDNRSVTALHSGSASSDQPPSSVTQSPSLCQNCCNQIDRPSQVKLSQVKFNDKTVMSRPDKDTNNLYLLDTIVATLIVIVVLFLLFVFPNLPKCHCT